MPIVYQGFGNVLTHPSQTITCPVNTVGVMGAGLARAMRNRIQGLYTSYKVMCEEADLRIGKVTVYNIPGENKQVLLFPSKEHWKNDSKLEYIEEGLKDISSRYKELGITELAITPVGCGLGKLDFTKEVKPLLVKYLDPLDIDVYILHRDDQAV